jgi:uncharacterized protein
LVSLQHVERHEHPIPARAGVGLKPQHWSEIISERPDIGWFEIHAENFMEAGGPPHHALSSIRDWYPLSVHGVGLSIGSAEGIDLEHLQRLKCVCDRYRPDLVSEHLAWSTHGGAYLADLLPLPYSQATLDLVVRHVDQVQSVLGRMILLENPSTYVQFAGTEMREVDFLASVAARTGCSLLLDVNNVLVSATNHGFDATSYVDSFPLESVGEIHVAGHHADRDDANNILLIDAHGSSVADQVWTLLARAVELGGRKPVLVEWDNDVPAWSTLQEEARKADRILTANAAGGIRAA